MKNKYIIKIQIVEVKKVKNIGDEEELLDDYKEIRKRHSIPKAQLYDLYSEAVQDAERIAIKD